MNVYNDGNRLVDTFLAESPGLIVPVHGEAMFRVVAPTSATDAEVKRVDVTVERARARDRRD